MKVKIYRLINPLNDETIYVGKTIGRLCNRLSGHVHFARHKTFPKDRYILDLLNQGFKPKIELIEEVDIENWVERETFWIEYYKKINKDLFNIQKGGGFLGINFRPENNLSNSERKSKSVYQLDFNYNFINKYKSCKEAAKITNIKHISNAVNTEAKKTAGGFIWVYESEYNNFLEKNNNTKHTRDFSYISKKVGKFDLSGNLIEEWPSCKEAAKSGYRYKDILRVARGERKTYKKFVWKFL